MLKEGYKFEAAKINVEKLETVNGVELSWTIGAMLSHVGQIEIDESSGFGFQGLLDGNLLCFCVLLPVYIWVQKRRRVPRRFGSR
jgi:apyrase